MARPRRWTDEQLREAVARSRTYKEVLTRLGLLPGGGLHYTIKHRIAELGIDISHFDESRRRARCRDDELARAVASCTSYSEVMRALALPVTAQSDAWVRRRVRVLGLDTRHFARAWKERSRRTRWSDEQLCAAVVASRSIAQVIRALGLIPAGGNYVQVQRRIAELALDISHFTGSGWNTEGFVPVPARPLHAILVKADRPTARSHALKLRLFREGIKQPRCERCGWAESAPDGRIPVELDHRNGDTSDNRLENLRILCPNCHSLQPTHRGLNRRSRRSAR